MKRLLSRVALAVLLADPAVAVTPFEPGAAVFYSDDVVRGALSDIAKMQEPELRASARYLAECNERAADPVFEHSCKVAYNAYRLEFAELEPDRMRQVDQLIVAREVIADSERLRVTSVPSGVAVDRINKMGIIYDKLQTAVRARFRELRAK
jgi:hypothetical protein